MEIKNIKLEELINTRQFDKGLKYHFYRKDGLFYKTVSLEKEIISKEKSNLLILESKLDMLENSGILSLEGICGPTYKLYYSDEFVGYAAPYLEGYLELIDASQILNNSQKINLLIQISKIIKRMHEKYIAHTDIYSDNVLTNGININLIDFDEACSFKTVNNLSYYNSLYADIDGLNNLIIRLLTIESFGKTKKSKNPTLPSDIIKYIKSFNESKYKGLVNPLIPSCYPHDWLNDLKPYIGESGYFQRRI